MYNLCMPVEFTFLCHIFCVSNITSDFGLTCIHCTHKGGWKGHNYCTCMGWVRWSSPLTVYSRVTFLTTNNNGSLKVTRQDTLASNFDD